MTKEEIIAKYPSICHSCEHGRKPASDENRDKGYVGCAEFLRKQKHASPNGIVEDDDVSFEKNTFFIREAKELGEGWVDLRARVFGQKSGAITNCQLLTLEVSKCDEYERIR